MWDHENSIFEWLKNSCQTRFLTFLPGMFIRIIRKGAMVIAKHRTLLMILLVDEKVLCNTLILHQTAAPVKMTNGGRHASAQSFITVLWQTRPALHLRAVHNIMIMALR